MPGGAVDFWIAHIQDKLGLKPEAQTNWREGMKEGDLRVREGISGDARRKRLTAPWVP